MGHNCRVRTTGLLVTVVAAAVALARPSPGIGNPQTATDLYVQPEVPYVPTRNDVSEAMLRIASVTKDDIVYDLGCGDGRIVIMAAKQFSAHGVGLDIDPRRIEESNENARKAGVADKVRFIEGDLFRADLSKATVVTLYLLPSVNLRLRPKLQQELRPGTRIVSHNYDMGDWRPLKQLQIDDHTVYLWVIPEKTPTAVR